MAHVVLVSVVVFGTISVIIVASFVVGAVLVGHASTWFNAAKRGRPLPPPRTLEVELPPHSAPASAI
jgi:hypothetical protein